MAIPKKKASLREWDLAVGSVLSQTRRDADISQHKFARMMGWHRSKVVKIEAGNIRLRFSEFMRAAEKLRIEPQQLLARVQRWNNRL